MPVREFRICPNCGGKIYKRSNSTIWPKLCPNCTLKELMKKPRAEKKQGEKKPRKKKTDTQKINKQLDDAWSLLVKLTAGNKCEYCGKTKPLNSHHIYSRSNQKVRWDEINGICLCVGHHIGNVFSAHKTGVEFTHWLEKYKGSEFMETLRIKAGQTQHYSYNEKLLIFEYLNNQIKKYKS